MPSEFRPRYPECVECVHFKTALCIRCKNGEFFEEEVEELDPDDMEFDIFKLTGSSDDE